MFRIRSRQTDLFRQEALRDFEERMLLHLKRFSSRHFDLLSDGDAIASIRLGSERAARHGFTAERSIRYWIEVTFMFGAAFDADPLLPWAGEGLATSAGQHQHSRIDRLYARAWQQAERERCDGAAERRLVVDLRRIGDVPNAPLFSPDVPPLLDRAITWAHRVFSVRCAHAGDVAVRKAIEACAELAHRRGVATERGVFIFVAMTFIAGSGFAADPLLPWVARILSSTTPSNSTERVDLLAAGAVKCLGQWWL
jgi:hypothetical protein